VDALGICGTDVEIFTGELPYLKAGTMRYPVVPGHEWVGRVAVTGEGVTSFAVGDRVTGETHLGCGECEFCLAGKYNACASMQRVGIGEPDAARRRDRPGLGDRMFDQRARLRHDRQRAVRDAQQGRQRVDASVDDELAPDECIQVVAQLSRKAAGTKQRRERRRARAVRICAEDRRALPGVQHPSRPQQRRAERGHALPDALFTQARRQNLAVADAVLKRHDQRTEC
jgi:hypothetical protein